MLPIGAQKLNDLQMNMIKSFMFLHDEKKINEIDSLINFYLEKQLDGVIEQVEADKGYTASVYEEWLLSANK